MKEYYNNTGCVISLTGPLEENDITPINTWLITHIGTFRLPKGKYRNKGYARSLMTEVLSDADKEGATLVLEVEPDPDTDYDRLVNWYKRLGFAFIFPVGSRAMRRLPLACDVCGATERKT